MTKSNFFAGAAIFSLALALIVLLPGVSLAEDTVSVTTTGADSDASNLAGE